MAKPSILLAPGSFAVPEFYDPIFEAVRAQGYDIRGLHLPSAGLRALEGRPGKPPGMYDDAAFIAHEIGTLADAGKDVVMIAHSYAGIPVSQAAKGLSKEERGKQSKPGGLVRLAYLTCLVPPLGGTAVSILAETPDEDKVDMKAGDDGWMWHHRPELTAKICFSSWPVDKGTAWVKKFSKHSTQSFQEPLTYAGYKDVPCSYLLCEKDLCIPASVQQAGIDLIEKESGRKVDVTRLEADHVPNWTAPDETIRWIVGLGEKSTSTAR